MSILSRVFSPSVEKINTERLPSGGVINYQGNFVNQSGQASQLGALTSVSWLFAVVNRIAQSIAAQEWKLYRVQNGEREEIDDHPAISLWKSANPFITRQDFLETSQQHMELVGEMWSETINLDRDDVIYTRNPNPLDAYRGIGVVQSMMVDLGAERAAAEWMYNFFKNSAEPGGVIEFPTTLQDADFERLVDRWRYQHQGVANAHRVAILERGTWKDRKLTQRDMQFRELREFERDQILGAFGMPLPIMGITESVNRANAEAAEVMYARWLVRPRLMRIKSALNEKLLKLYPDGDSLEFDYIDPVPENRESLIAEASVGYEKKILTLNEARRRFGEDDWEGEEGDALASSPADPMDGLQFDFDGEEAGYKPRRRPRKVAANDEYPDEANTEANRMERGWRRRFANELSAIIAHLEATSKSFSTKLNVNEVAEYDWNWWAKYGAEVVEELAESFALVIATEAPAMSPPQVQRLASLYAEQRGAALLRADGPLNLANMTRRRVRQLVARTVETGESLNTLTDRLSTDLSFSPDRARMIARTETATALGQGQREAAKSQGRTEKRWVTQADDRVNQPICATNGTQDWIPITAGFQSGHDTIPGHINCRCVVQYRNTPLADERSFIPEVRCPQCNRKHGENVAVGTQIKCRRCKHTWEV
jgi:phage portal protein BeeE